MKLVKKQHCPSIKELHDFYAFSSTACTLGNSLVESKRPSSSLASVGM